MKRIVSMLLAALIVLTGLSFPVFAEDAAEFATITEDMISVEGGTLEYDSYLSSYKITPDAAGELVTIVASIDGYFAMWLPATAQDAVLDIEAEFGTNWSLLRLNAGHKFQFFGMNTNNTDAKMTYTPSDVYSIYLYDQMATADDLGAFVYAANGSLEDYDEEYLDLSTYDVGRYTKSYWDGDIVFNESFMVIEEKDGSIAPNAMMYEIDRVVSVKNSFLNVEYVYGKDYTVEDGKLVIPEGSAIRSYTYDTIYKDSATANSGFWKTLDGTYVYAGQHNMYFTGYLNITYTVKDAWGGPVPEAKGAYLPNATKKLNTAGETVKILGIGDSIAGGANVSADTGNSPYADAWCEMTCKAIQEKYSDVNVDYDVIAQGGATATLAIEKMNDIIAFAPDLLMIEFGTNECMAGESDAYYINTLVQAIEAVNANLPDCDIILVAPIISNPLIFPTDWFYSYADALYTLEREGVAVADSTSILQYLISRKDYIDMTGDFLCHPNDFANRVFVQSILATLTEGSDSEYISGLANRITKYRYQWEFDSADWANFCTIAEEGKAAILACGDKEAARAKYIEYTDLLDAVPTSADNVANSKIDVSTLVFNTSKPIEIVDSSATQNVVTKFDAEEKALAIILNNTRGIKAGLNYTKGDELASADDYDYVVITMKTPLTNSANAKASKFTYSTTAGSCATVTVDLTINGAYNSYIIDMSNEANWTGDISLLSILPFASAKKLDTLLISSIILAKDSESAADIAIERERIANNNAAEAVTCLMADDATSAILTAPNGGTYLAGDVDGNGRVNAVDSLFMRKYLAFADFELPNPVALDADASGSIDVADLLCVRKTIVGIINAQYVESFDAKVSYSTQEKAAQIVLGRDNATLTADLSEAGLSADMFKYVTVCAKHENGEALGMTITLTYAEGSTVKTVEIPSTEFFAATVAKFTEAKGDIISIAFTLDARAGETVYFDSFVLTPTVSAAENAVAVRVGAANLF